MATVECHRFFSPRRLTSDVGAVKWRLHPSPRRGDLLYIAHRTSALGIGVISSEGQKSGLGEPAGCDTATRWSASSTVGSSATPAGMPWGMRSGWFWRLARLSGQSTPLTKLGGLAQPLCGSFFQRNSDRFEPMTRMSRPGHVQGSKGGAVRFHHRPASPANTGVPA